MHLWKLLLLLRLFSALAFTPSRHSIQKFQKFNALSRNIPFSRYLLSVESNLRLASRADDEDDGRGAKSVYSDLALENPLVLSLAMSDFKMLIAEITRTRVSYSIKISSAGMTVGKLMSLLLPRLPKSMLKKATTPLRQHETKKVFS